MSASGDFWRGSLGWRASAASARAVSCLSRRSRAATTPTGEALAECSQCGACTATQLRSCHASWQCRRSYWSTAPSNRYLYAALGTVNEVSVLVKPRWVVAGFASERSVALSGKTPQDASASRAARRVVFGRRGLDCSLSPRALSRQRRGRTTRDAHKEEWTDHR